MNENAYLILAALAEQPMHGYDIGKAVTELSNGEAQLSVGALHGAIQRLAAEGEIEPERQETVNGRLRRYYQITDQGMRALAGEVERLRHRVAVGDNALTLLCGAEQERRCA